MTWKPLLLSALLLTACSSPTSPTDGVQTPPAASAPAAGRSLGLFEITFIGGGNRPLSVTAQPAGLRTQTLTDQTGLTLAPLARSDFDLNGSRNLQATFAVTNSSGAALTNLTFLAVSTAGTIRGTPIGSLQKFDGSAADPAIATQVKPSQPKTLDVTTPVINQKAALFQTYTEAEVAPSALPRPSGVTDIFPYGFVAALPGSGSRTLPAGSTNGQVTFSFDLPLQSMPAADPFKVSVMVEAYIDSVPTVTQSPDELDAAGSVLVRARIDALKAQFPGVPVSVKTLGCPAGGSPVAQRIPLLRTAGPAGAPTATLGSAASLLSLTSLSPDPYAASSAFLDPVTVFKPGFDQTLALASTFKVRGLQSGPLETYGDASSLGASGKLFAGEEVELVLSGTLTGQTNGGHLCAPVVGRYRVRTLPEGAAGFQGQATSPAGASPTAVALGDIYGGGEPVVVTANSVDNTVSFRFGQGTIFESQVTYGVGLAPASVAFGDVNGDGRPDLVTANLGDNTVSVLLGQGGGTFAPQVTYGVGNAPASVAVGDVNGDGRPDLITANSSGNTVSVLLGLVGQAGLFGQVSSTFAPQVTYAVGSNPVSVAVGDVNGDGRLDLVTANSRGNTVSVLLGQPGGTFAPQVTYGVGALPSSVAVGDVNGDGRPDLVTANLGNNTVSVLLGQPGGTFAPQVTYAVGSNPISVALGDVNGDGRLDLATANLSSNTVSVLLGQAGGTFAPQVTYAAGKAPRSIALGDVNRDGRLDLVTANFNDNTVSVLTKK